MNTTDVENFPGFRDGIMGPQLMDEMRAQAERFGAELVADDVTAVDLTGDVKVVTDGDGNEHRARAVILATGSGYRKLGIADEERLSGHGVSWCATCDGFFFRDQHIAVVGGGDSAVEEATFLSRFGSKVYAGPPPRRAARLEDHAGAGLRRPEDRLRLELRRRGDPRRRQADRPHAVRHRAPARRVTSTPPGCSSRSVTTLARSCSTARSTSTRTATCWSTSPSTRTNLAGVFACGDLVDHHYRQAVTAAGTGCAAALDAERFLAALDHAASSAGPSPHARSRASETDRGPEPTAGRRGKKRPCDRVH